MLADALGRYAGGNGGVNYNRHGMGESASGTEG